MKIKPFHVIPNLPEPLKALRSIGMNTWFTWNWPAVQLFLRLDAPTWEQCRQNLIMMLGQLPQKLYDETALDDSFIANLQRVENLLNEYLAARTWFDEYHPAESDLRVAYFSMEFGLGVSLPVYSGGLGLLAGDHLKATSDLGTPLVGVGLLYQQGYFEQYLNIDGWQGERYPINDWYNMPVSRVKGSDGKPLTVAVDLAGETLTAHIWKVLVGRTCLYLLDANISENPAHLRRITSQLYGGDRENRLRQEILLGIGGVRALEKLGIQPTVYHMNEGHSAFLALERLRRLIKNYGLTFAEAREAVWSSTVFTTHTPVPAGNEVFEWGLIQKYFKSLTDGLGLTWEQFQQLGQEEPGRSPEFSMTVFALKLAAHCNGVSKLHGKVSRNMWRKIWLNLPEDEIPIGSITNGIHTKSWISHDMEELLVRYIGPKFIEEYWNPKLWERVDAIPDGELWRIHQIRKERLIFFSRKRVKNQLRRRGAGSSEIQAAEEVLSSDALLIGFARRFAPYKRADLLLRDPGRLIRLLTNSARPVNLIIAGKAHPQENPGKDLIRKIVHFANQPEVRNHMIFLENYDINVAQYMVQGMDVWLSNPRRPQEASGTSGMKACCNGALNVSTLDGWWDEAYTTEVGWAIGSGEMYDNDEEQDRVESEALFHLLENEVIPLFYERDRTELPRKWIAMMKRSMKVLGAQFNTGRMVQEYIEKYYIPAHRAGQALTGDKAQIARQIAKWRERVMKAWPGVQVISDDIGQDLELVAGETLPVKVRVNLGGLSPDDITVEVIHGNVNGDGQFSNYVLTRLTYIGESDGLARYEGRIVCAVTGMQGFAVRVRPYNPELVHSLTPLVMTWE
ncbi:MAG: glycosyltransferase family 1 protein [Calditrichaeota bacterium]|nr:glycosyltransferase family 1 protein [Calditrichota bacterium]